MRFKPQIHEGLSNEQIESRKKENLVNYDTTVPTKSIKAIIIGNLFTIFNLLNFALALAVFFTGSYKNMTFMVIVLCNAIISTYQEIRSKKAVDKLAVVSATKVTAIRNSKEESIGINEIVLDDILKISTGNQIVTDCIIREGEVEVNESFITGEPDAVFKKTGDMLLSGSFIVSGNCLAQVEHIAGDNYTAKIGHDAKQIKRVKSQIMMSLNKVIKTVSILIIPVGALLLFNQIHVMGESFGNAVLQTVAALIGMIPEGLILLTSTVLAVSVIRLSKSKVLVQQLYCIETLARVDTLCLDKTGTITEGTMEVKDVIVENGSKEELEKALAEFGGAIEDNNTTINAIRNKFGTSNKWKVVKKIPFSSQRKWSGILFENEGSFVLGAPEFILGEVKEISSDSRVLALAKSKEDFNGKELPNNLVLFGYILIQDKIRDEAKDTLNYFKEQGVTIKIISGDNPKTVSNISKIAGVEGYDKYIDMSKVETEDLTQIVKDYTIFGRVSPSQKQELIKALKQNGHTVAMTGDGVNDVLALQESDCSIAIASGSEAARNVAQLVLLDSNFSSMPKIVAEGRRTINNIERSSELFLTKTIFTTILAVLFVFITMPYPFKPIQISLISVVTIGIPSFVLALQPNKQRVKGSFLRNVLSRAFPTSLTMVCNIIMALILKGVFNLSNEVYATMCVLLTTITGFTLLIKLCRPFNLLRTALCIFVIVVFLFEVFLLDWLFNLTLFNLKELIVFGGAVAFSEAIYIILYNSIKKWREHEYKKAAARINN